MRVFLLGGAGLVGQSVAERLAKNAAVSEITIAGRNSDKANQAASGIGEKANSMKADATDEKQIARLVHDYDIFVNTSGPDYLVQPHTVNAALRAGVHYCDVSCDGPAAEKVLKRVLPFDARAGARLEPATIPIISFTWTPHSLQLQSGSCQLSCPHLCPTVRDC